MDKASQRRRICFGRATPSTLTESPEEARQHGLALLAEIETRSRDEHRSELVGTIAACLFVLAVCIMMLVGTVKLVKLVWFI